MQDRCQLLHASLLVKDSAELIGMYWRQSKSRPSRCFKLPQKWYVP